jgi:hypothetical protein
MPRTIEEIRATAKASKQTESKPASTGAKTSSFQVPSVASSGNVVLKSEAFKMPSLQKGHSPANASGKRRDGPTPSQTPKASGMKKKAGDYSSSSTPAIMKPLINGAMGAARGALSMQDKDGEEFEVASSRASTPETLPEEPPMLAEEGTGNVREFEMTVTHSCILILISKYAQCALTSDDHESWIRGLSLNVLINEMVVGKALMLDYAPSSVRMSFEGASRRMFLNMSQEGRSAVEDLREQKLVNGLKLTSEDFQSVNAYNVLLKSLQFLKTLPNDLFEKVNASVYAPHLITTQSY